MSVGLLRLSHLKLFFFQVVFKCEFQLILPITIDLLQVDLNYEGPQVLGRLEEERGVLEILPSGAPGKQSRGAGVAARVKATRLLMMMVSSIDY